MTREAPVVVSDTTDDDVVEVSTPGMRDLGLLPENTGQPLSQTIYTGAALDRRIEDIAFKLEYHQNRATMFRDCESDVRHMRQLGMDDPRRCSGYEHENYLQAREQLRKIDSSQRKVPGLRAELARLKALKH
jgi:hypothetical protein